MALSTLQYDFVEVGMAPIKVHLIIKIFISFFICVLPGLKKIPEEFRAYLLILLIYSHGLYNGLYIDSAYHQSFNQAAALFLILGANCNLRFYLQIIVFGLVLNLVILKFGPGFSYVASYKGDPLSNYAHGAIIYTIISIYAYFFVVRKNIKKIQEIKKLAGIGLRSSYLMHEIKNIKLASEQNSQMEILDCIGLIVSDKIEKADIDIKKEVEKTMILFDSRIKLSKIKIGLSGESFSYKCDEKSLQIILKNLILNAIEHVEENEKEKSINIELKGKELKFRNPLSQNIFIDQIIEERKSTKASPSNKGLGLNIIKEMCDLNKIKILFSTHKNNFEAKLTF